MTPSIPVSTASLTPTTTTPEPVSAEGDFATLEAAAAQLRGHIDQRWVEVADRVMNKALLATRRSLPVRAEAEHGPVNVSEQVLTTYIRAAIADIPAAAPTAIALTVDPDNRCTAVTIEITVQYNHPVLPIADKIRNHTETVLRELLGPVIPTVTVRDMHVHVSDVTTTNPHTGRDTPPPDRDPAERS